jgi:hypothetical protein
MVSRGRRVGSDSGSAVKQVPWHDDQVRQLASFQGASVMFLEARVPRLLPSWHGAPRRWRPAGRARSPCPRASRLLPPRPTTRRALNTVCCRSTLCASSRSGAIPPGNTYPWRCHCERLRTSLAPPVHRETPTGQPGYPYTPGSTVVAAGRTRLRAERLKRSIRPTVAVSRPGFWWAPRWKR